MYDFKQLSPADFEDLTRDLLQQEWGILLESFKSGRDQGIDLRFATGDNGHLIVQCKRFVDSTVAKLVRHLHTEELPKITKLAPNRYVLVTALPLSPADKQKIFQVLSPYIHSVADILGNEDINNLLGIHQEIETKNFKLWLSSISVLKRVLENAIRVQTDFDVERVRRSIPLYVQNAGYTRATQILESHRVVIISGAPGVGKTTLADMLLYAHLEAGYAPVVIQSDISEAKTSLSTGARQVFYFDDFLGQTFLGNRFDFVGKKEDAALLDFIEMVERSKHSKLILTTREHILKQALQISDRFQRADGFFVDRKCVLEIGDYSLIDRGRILFNHIFFSDLPSAYRTELLKGEFYMKILKHRNFNPRLIEWLSRYTNVRGLSVDSYQPEVLRVLEHPEQLWKIAFEQQVSESARSLILSLYSLGGSTTLDQLELCWKALNQYRSEKYNWRTSAEDWRRSLKDLEGGFLFFNGNTASFVNPSVKDFLEATLCSNTGHYGDLLAVTQLFKQVSNLWSLAKSEKGEELRKLISKQPRGLLDAVNRHLYAPHEDKIDFGNNSYGMRPFDVKPEMKLATIISIAYRLSDHAALKFVDEVDEYASEVIRYWSGRSADFEEITGILRGLSKAKDQRFQKLHLLERLKDAALRNLNESAGSSDLESMIKYAEEDYVPWTTDDQAVLVSSFNEYLDENFDDELSSCNDKDEYEGLLDSLEKIARFCDSDITYYEERINSRIADIPEPEYDGDADARGWRGQTHSTTEQRQEAEIRQMFGGLRDD